MSDAPSSKPVFINAERVAELLAISTATVYEHAGKESLPFPAYRVGRSWRFKVDEVEKFLGVQLDLMAGQVR